METQGGADGSQGPGAEDPANAGNRRRALLAPASVQFPQEERRRSRSREPGNASIPPGQPVPEETSQTKQEEFQAIKALVEKELESLVSPEISKHIKRVTLELSDKIYALQRTKSRLEKAEEEVRLLEEKRLPNGVRRVPIPFETPLLESPVGEDVEFTIRIPAGTSLREAKSMVHFAALSAQKKLDLKVVSLQREELRKITRKDVFVTKGLEAFRQQAHNWSVLDLDLEDDEADVRGISETNLTAKLHTIYKKTVDKIAADVKRKADAEDRSRISRANLVAQLSRTPPADLLNQAIDDRIAAVANLRKPKKKQQQQCVNSAALFVAASDSTLDQETVARNLPSALPKNGLSPARGGGNTDKGKAKGKGKTKDASWTSSKAKGKGKQTPARSSDGKAKGKQTTKGRGKGAGDPRSSKGQGSGKGYGPYKGASKGKQSYQ